MVALDRRDGSRLHSVALLAGLILVLGLYLQEVTRTVAAWDGGWRLPLVQVGLPSRGAVPTAGSGAGPAPPGEQQGGPGGEPAGRPGGATPPAGPPPGPTRPAGTPVALTSGQTLDGFPDWSPDGRQIAFMRNGRIWVMPAAGGKAQPLSPAGKLWEVAPAWSPDGRGLAVVRYGRESEVGSSLVLLTPGEGREEELLRLPGPIGYLAWAPDGGALALTADQRLLILDRAARESRTLVQVGPEVELLAGGVAWSRDGQWIFYGAGERVGSSLQYQIYRVPVAGGRPVAITTEGGMMPSLSPESRRLAYRRPGPPGAIVVMDLESREVTTWARDGDGMRYFHPRWSPDGRRIIVSRLSLEGDGGNVHLRSHLVVLQ